MGTPIATWPSPSYRPFHSGSGFALPRGAHSYGLDIDDPPSAACMPDEIVNLSTVTGHDVRVRGSCDHCDERIDNIRSARLSKQATRLVSPLLGHRDYVAASQQTPELGLRWRTAHLRKHWSGDNRDNPALEPYSMVRPKATVIAISGDKGPSVVDDRLRQTGGHQT
ncbi:MAG TPA: hypothetical protein VMS00_15120 [Acidimicrobiales bacterium]|nr:hypothetical protein [Acidimicrobiales bacterium]